MFITAFSRAFVFTRRVITTLPKCRRHKTFPSARRFSWYYFSSLTPLRRSRWTSRPAPWIPTASEDTAAPIDPSRVRARRTREQHPSRTTMNEPSDDVSGSDGWVSFSFDPSVLTNTRPAFWEGTEIIVSSWTTECIILYFANLNENRLTLFAICSLSSAADQFNRCSS